jgi:predicted transcriptional regulator
MIFVSNLLFVYLLYHALLTSISLSLKMGKMQVGASLKELDEGKGIPHEEVEQRISKWLVK